MTLIDGNNIWYNPVYIYHYCFELVQKNGTDFYVKNRIYQDLVESRDLSMIALLLYELNKNSRGTSYVQICKNDPPDGYVMQPSKATKGQFDILPVELTRYLHNTNKSLLEQLKDSKLDKKRDYSGLIVVKIETSKEINYNEVVEYIGNADLRFSVWAIKVLQNNYNTMCELHVFNPKPIDMIVDIGKAAHDRLKENGSNVIEAKRTSSLDKVRVEENNNIDKKYLDKNFGWLN